MRIKHVSLKSFTSSTSVGVVTFDAEGCADVTEEQGKFLCQPGLGFKSLEPAPEPVVETTTNSINMGEFIPATGSVETAPEVDEEAPEEEPAPTPPATPNAKAAAKPAPKKRR